MTSNLKAHLQALAAAHPQGFMGEIRQRAPQLPAKAMARRLQNFVFVIPEMVNQIRAWMDESSSTPTIKRLHGFMMTYLYHPLDYVPEATHGLFGYLDDAYFVGQLYLASLQQKGTPTFLPNTESVARQLSFWLYWTRRLLPKETKKIDALMDDLKHQNVVSFERMMMNPSPA